MKGTLTGMIICLLTLASFGQVRNTKFTGKVTDASTNSPIVNASVTVEGTSIGTKTDADGNFFLNLETGKKYSIQVSYVGYQSKLVSEVQVLGTENAPLNVVLEKSANNLGGIVVKTSAKKESVATLYSIQKNSSSISDAISAEVIKKSPDRAASDVVKRMSGTSVQDNKFIVIRGLNERYNTSMLNNSVLPSTEPDKKAFSFDIIPSTLIDHVTIYKSPTPDLPGDFAGGAVKVSTRDFPSRKLSEVGFSVGYNSQTSFKNFYKGYPQGKMDWLGFFDDSRLIPGAYYQNRNAAFSTLPVNTQIAITKTFSNSYGKQVANVSQPAFAFTYTGGNTKLIKDNKLGYIYSVNYGHSRRVVDRTRDEYESYDFHNYMYNTVSYDMRSNLSALLNLSYSYKKSRISLKNLFNNDFVSSFADRRGIGGTGGNSLTDPTTVPFKYKSQNTEATGNGLVNSVLEGIHNLNKSWIIDWNGSYGMTYRWQPDQHILTYKTNGDDNSYFIKLNNQNSPVIQDAGRIYSFLTENIFGANMNVTKQFMWKGNVQKLKAGTMNYYRTRAVEVNAVGMSTANIVGVSIPETKNTTFNTLFTPANIDQYGIINAPIGASSTDYDGTAMLNSAYVMLDNRFSNKIKLTWGVRAEKYSQELTSQGKPKLTRDNTDILPSFLFTYALNNKANIRVASSQSVNRPEFRELATYRVYDYENDFIIVGNNLLERSKNTNADLRFEIFPNAGEIFSASVFYKYFKNPIEQTNLNNSTLSWDNAENADVYGVELEMRKRLTFFNSNFFDRLTFYANGAYMKGSVKYKTVSFNSPLQGQSPYLVNTGLSYSTDNDNLSFNLLYNRIGQRLKFRSSISSGGRRDIYERSRDVIDFQVGKKLLHNQLELKLTVSDLLAQPFSWYYKFEENPSSTKYDASKDRVLNSYKFGTNVSLGVRYNFK